MKKVLKLLSYSLLTVFMVFSMLVENTNAANGLSISASSKSVKEGSTFTVTVKASSNVFVEGLSLSCSGGNIVSNLKSKSLDKGESTTATIKLTGEKCTVSVSGTAANYDTETETGASASVTVTKKKETTNNNTNTSKPNNNTNNNTNNNKPSSNTNNNKPDSTEKKSDDNNLKSLKISTGKLAPSFNAEKTKYNIDLPGNVNEVTIEATANHSKASVSGTGTKKVKVGENKFDIVCSAEDGSKKTYTLIFHVDETPLVYTKYNEVDLGVVRLLEGIKIPEGFKEATIQLESQNIEGFNNEKLNLSIAYLVDERGNKDFYIINDNKVISPFKKIEINGKDYYIIDNSSTPEELSTLIPSELTINDVNLNGWKYENEELRNYTIVSLMNSEGQEKLYTYEASEGTLQLSTHVQENNTPSEMVYILIGTTGVFMLTTILVSIRYFYFKKKKVEEIKNFYERKASRE